MTDDQRRQAIADALIRLGDCPVCGVRDGAYCRPDHDLPHPERLVLAPHGPLVGALVRLARYVHEPGEALIRDGRQKLWWRVKR